MMKKVILIVLAVMLSLSSGSACRSEEKVEAFITPSQGTGSSTNGAVVTNKPMVRIKDITHLRGVCENQLIGFGIVAGLNGTGDKKGISETALPYVLKNLGVYTTIPSGFTSKNMAAVMVTGNLPPFAKSGDNIDVVVSSIGDAKSLEGGVLYLTELRAANGAVFATAQGPVSIGGLNLNKTGGTGGWQNYTLTGRVLSGGLICRDMNTELTLDRLIYLVLNEPDFNTASLIAQAINRKHNGDVASAIDSQTVRINNICNSPVEAVEFISSINSLEIMTEPAARVVINERTGTVVVGGDVKILPVAISHGSIQIIVGDKKEDPKKAQKGSVFAFATGADISTMVSILNQVGVSPKDIISILQALKKAQALPAELIVL